jgi:hypothetical protein
VLSHFSADHSSAKEMSLSQQLRRIEWIETEGEVGALLLRQTGQGTSAHPQPPPAPHHRPVRLAAGGGRRGRLAAGAGARA